MVYLSLDSQQSVNKFQEFQLEPETSGLLPPAKTLSLRGAGSRPLVFALRHSWPLHYWHPLMEKFIETPEI